MASLKERELNLRRPFRDDRILKYDVSFSSHVHEYSTKGGANREGLNGVS